MGVTAIEGTAGDPAAIVAAVEAGCQRFATPMPAGRMVWRRWAGPANAPVLTLLHGGSGSWNHWIRNIGPLRQHFTLLVPDLPGTGDSDTLAPPYDGWTIARIACRGLLALVPAGEPARLVGFSFGAVIGTLMAALLGDGARTLVLAGPGGMGGPYHRTPLTDWRKLDRPADRTAAHRANLATLMIGDPARVDPLAVHLQEINLPRGRTKSPAISRLPVIVEALPRVTARLGAIFGSEDAISHDFLPQREQALREIHPDVDFKVVPGSGHWVPYDRPEAFNATLMDMLTRLERKA